jgi:hypothetical protein
MSAVFTEMDLPLLAVDLPSYLYTTPINLNEEIMMSMGYSADKASLMNENMYYSVTIFY